MPSIYYLFKDCKKTPNTERIRVELAAFKIQVQCTNKNYVKVIAPGCGKHPQWGTVTTYGELCQ